MLIYVSYIYNYMCIFNISLNVKFSSSFLVDFSFGAQDVPQAELTAEESGTHHESLSEMQREIEINKN